MEIEIELSELIRKKDHLNVLRYIRIHQLREPNLVVDHGKLLLGTDLCGKLNCGDVVRLALLEQICLGALDCNQPRLAERCLNQLNDSGVESGSNRFRFLLARCLEADGDTSGAEIIYDDLVKENPSCILGLKRQYCLLKCKTGQIERTIESLNTYLEQNYSDTAAWYELAKLRMDIGDYKGASFCLEEVLIASPSSALIHCELAECYATAASENLDELLSARKHMAEAVELNPTLARAQIGLVTVSYAYLQLLLSKTKDNDEFELDVTKELIRYGAELFLNSYEGTKLYSSIKMLMNVYTECL